MNNIRSVLAAGPLVWALGMSTSAAALDFDKYCNASAAPTVIFLVDRTEIYDDVDKRRFSTGVVKLLSELKPGERFLVFPITNAPGRLTPDWDSCVPGCSESAVSTGTDSAYCGSLLAVRDKRRFQQNFVGLMRQYATQSVTAAGTQLIRTLHALSREVVDVTVRRLVIFSDMLEFSHLSRGKISQADLAWAKTLIRRTRRDYQPTKAFANTDVVAFGFGKRLGKDLVLPQQAANTFRAFWQHYFTGLAKAGSVRIRSNY